jgi:hypothetical protein
VCIRSQRPYEGTASVSTGFRDIPKYLFDVVPVGCDCSGCTPVEIVSHQVCFAAGRSVVEIPCSHRERIDLCLIDPRDHAPSTSINDQMLVAS